MKKSLQISEQRRLLKQEITELIEENLPAKILQFAGRSVQRLTRQTKPAPWYIGTLLLMLVSFLPQTLIAFILKQPEQVIGKGLVWSSSNVVVIPLIPTVYLITRYILIITRDHIVDAMNESRDLDDLRIFLAGIGNPKQALRRALVASILWSVVAISIFSISNHQLIYISYSIDVWIWGFCALGIGSQLLLWQMQFPSHFKNYHYNLYELNPSRSEVIPHISNIFTRPFLITALYLAIGTFYASLFQVYIWVVFVIVIIFWVPLVIQFINSQLAITHIIITEKWRVLNQLQEHINKQKHSPNLNSQENIESVNKLMDLHERVYNSRSTQLTVNSIFDLLNQLFLPLLAFLISNYNDVLKLLNLKP